MQSQHAETGGSQSAEDKQQPNQKHSMSDIMRHLIRVKEILDLQPFLIWNRTLSLTTDNKQYLVSEVCSVADSELVLALLEAFFEQTTFHEVVTIRSEPHQDNAVRIAVDYDSMSDELVRAMESAKNAKLRHLVHFLNQLSFPSDPFGKWIHGSNMFPYYEVFDEKKLNDIPYWTNFYVAKGLKKAAFEYCRMAAINIEPSELLSSAEMALYPVLKQDGCSYSKSNPTVYPLVISPLYLVLFQLMRHAMPNYYAIEGSRVTREKYLGMGSDANVYMASYNGVTVACKVLKSNVRGTISPHKIRSSLNERRIYQIIAHAKTHDPHDTNAQYIVPFLGAIDCGPHSGVINVLAFCTDPSLDKWIEYKKLTPELCENVAYDVVHGLAYLHKIGIIHRDMKSANIFLSTVQGDAPNTKKIRAQTGDFGLAKMSAKIGSKAKEKISGDERECAGTPLSLPPEALLHIKQDMSGDVWGFGCVLWAMHHGDEPNAEIEKFNALVNKVAITRKMPPIDDKTTPEKIRHVIRWCWEYESGNRVTSEQLAKVFEDPESKDLKAYVEKSTKPMITQ